MSVLTNPQKYLLEFKELMSKVDQYLNEDALKRPDYYRMRNGTLLEDDVKNALDKCASGTPFRETVKKVSGQRFPDIVVADYFGVEVKSTKDDNWKSTGSSILETTRDQNVKVVYMTFGKLGGIPIEFLSRPYEECLSEIAVTHMPRYLIDMQLKTGQTIFDKMDISYDDLRRRKNPTSPVASYYKKLLKPGERLWWTGDSEDEAFSATIRLWKNIDRIKKREYTVYGCVNYPEVFGGNYDGYAVWLTSQGVVDPHVRDQFSAGGKEPMRLSNGSVVKLPGVYRRVKDNIGYFMYRMRNKNSSDFLCGGPKLTNKELKRKVLDWAELASKAAAKSASKDSRVEFDTSMDALETLFFSQNK